ncbi:hypothetical protein SLEP1_g55804 [Rubroshorea leprosula]|uniref:Uncharacterized protein n=1 Tax=Rubroshorea leprosula TaxID=152421 RepID=A0AAV5MJQ4_9ROSI|nr:hypothetical protein SLEP1_g55804 [Rubroshorea leprosula]
MENWRYRTLRNPYALIPTVVSRVDKNRAAFQFLLICAQFSHKHHLCLSLRILLRLLSFCVAKHFGIRAEFNCAGRLKKGNFEEK